MKILIKTFSILNLNQKRSLFFLLILSIIATALEVLSIGLIFPLIEVFLNPENFKSNFFSKFNIFFFNTSDKLILFSILMLLSIYFLKFLFLIFFSWCKATYNLNVRKNLSKDMFDNYLFRDYTFHNSTNSSNLIRNVITEVNEYSNVLSHLMIVISETLILFGIFLLLIMIEPISTISIIIFFTLLGLISTIVTRGYLFDWGKQRQFHDGLRLKHLQQGFSGIKEIILYGKRSFFSDVYEVHNAKSARASKLNRFVRDIPRLGLELISVSAILLVFAYFILIGEKTDFVLPIMGIYAAAAFKILPSISKILTSLQSINFNKASVDVILKEIKNKYIPDRIKNSSIKTMNFEKKILIENLSFSYPKVKENILNNVNLEILKGKIVGIIGESGSGKSTFINLLAGLIFPNHGNIKIDNINIEDNRIGWQRQIGYVSQDIYLLDDSIKKNVALGIPESDINESSLKKAISDAKLSKFVASLEEKENSLVGERGSNLSGGQLQRVGIARALYREPSVLILDEATSALDLKTEEYLLNDLSDLRGKKTIIIVTHRQSSLKICDEVYEISNNKIIFKK